MLLIDWHARSLEHVEWCTVAPWLWRWNFSWVFASKFWWVRANAGTNFDLSTGQLSRWIPVEIGLRLIAWDACFDREFGSSIFFFWWESGLELHIFSTTVFPIRAVFPPTLEKESSNFSLRVWTYLFSFGAEGRGSGNPRETKGLCAHHFSSIWRPNYFSDQSILRRVNWCLFLIDCWPHTFSDLRTSILFPTSRLLHGLTDVPAFYLTTWSLSPTWRPPLLGFDRQAVAQIDKRLSFWQLTFLPPPSPKMFYVEFWKSTEEF